MECYCSRLEVYVSVFIVCFIAVASAQCPDPCVCDGGTVDCSGQGLTEIPDRIPDNVTELILKNNSISAINSTTLSKYPQLEKVDISQNFLTGIETGTFYNLSRLLDVNLTGNHLDYVERGAFELVDLNSLILSNNPMLQEVDQAAFLNATVRQFYVSGCSFRTMHQDLFTGMEDTLKVFRMFNNMAPLKLGDFLFRGFDLAEVFIINSSLSDLQFLNGARVHTLELNDNPLGDKVWALQGADIQELYLQRVGLTTVNISKPWPQLIVLDLTQNEITEVETEQFRHCPNLYSLILRDNSLKIFPEKLGETIGNLTILDLGSNFIVRLEAKHLVGINLEVLDLENNLIRTIPKALEAKLSDMDEIKLTGNPLHCNCEMLWFRDWVQSLRPDDTKVELGECVTPRREALLRIPKSEYICIPPTVVPSAPTSIRVGDDVTMQCTARGDPLPVVSLVTPWGEEITSDDVTNSTVNKIILVYVAKNFNCSMGGEFTCTAVAVTVEGQPTDVDTAFVSVEEDKEPLCDLSTVTVQPTDETTVADSDDDSDDTYIIVIVVIVVIVIVVVLVVLAVLWRKKIKRAYHVSPKRSRSANASYANKAMEENHVV